MLRRTAENNKNLIPNNTDWRLINKPPPRTNPTNVHANPDPNNKPPLEVNVGQFDAIWGQMWGQCKSIRCNSRSIRGQPEVNGQFDAIWSQSEVNVGQFDAIRGQSEVDEGQSDAFRCQPEVKVDQKKEGHAVKPEGHFDEIQLPIRCNSRSLRCNSRVNLMQFEVNPRSMWVNLMYFEVNLRSMLTKKKSRGQARRSLWCNSRSIWCNFCGKTHA